jgi:hypothetical protein
MMPARAFPRLTPAFLLVADLGLPIAAMHAAVAVKPKGLATLAVVGGPNTLRLMRSAVHHGHRLREYQHACAHLHVCVRACVCASARVCVRARVPE